MCILYLVYFRNPNILFKCLELPFRSKMLFFLFFWYKNPTVKMILPTKKNCNSWKLFRFIQVQIFPLKRKMSFYFNRKRTCTSRMLECLNDILKDFVCYLFIKKNTEVFFWYLNGKKIYILQWALVKLDEFCFVCVFVPWHC